MNIRIMAIRGRFSGLRIDFIDCIEICKLSNTGYICDPSSIRTKA